MARATTTESSRLEFEFALGQQERAGGDAKPLPGIIEVGQVGDPQLAPAVVPPDRALEPHRQTELLGGGLRLGNRSDLRPRRHGCAGVLDESALGQPVLGHDQRPVPGPDRDDGRNGLDDRRRDVLELVGHDGARIGQAKRRPDVVVGADDELVGDRRRGTVRIRVEDRHPIAHRAGRHPEHPPELAAAEDADDGRRLDRGWDAHPGECTEPGRLEPGSASIRR